MEEGQPTGGLTLRFPKLHDRNYRTWRFDMRMFLNERGLYSLVDRKDLEEPPTNEEEEARPGAKRQFRLRESRALATIALGIEPDMKPLIRNCATAIEAWEVLSAIFEPVSRARIGHLRKEFVLMKKQANESMAKYLSRVQNAVTDLEEAGKKIDEDDVAFQMICGLPRDWDSVVERLYALDDKEFVPKTIKDSLLTEYERRNPTTPPLPSGQDDTHAILMASNQRPGRGRSNNRGGQRGRGRQRGKSSFRQGEGKKKNNACFSCGGQGHFARECPTPNPRAGFKRPNAQSEDTKHAYLAEANVVDATEVLWLFDTAATHHFCHDKSVFKHYRQVDVRPAVLAEGTSQIKGIGEVNIQVMVDHHWVPIKLQEVMHAPNMKRNLISGVKLFERGCRIASDPEGMTIYDQEGQKVIKAPLENRFFVVKSRRQTVANQPSMPQASCAETTTPSNVAVPRPHKTQNPTAYQQEETPQQETTKWTDMELWHNRLNHVNPQAIRKMIKEGKVRGVKTVSADNPICSACRLGKSTHAKHAALIERSAKEPLELIHTDVCGPMPVASIGGARYFITFIDDFTRRCVVYTMRTKDEAFEKFKVFQAIAERETGRKIKRLRSDNGAEYCSNIFSRELTRLGIKPERSNVYNPQMNGVAERLNRTLMDSVRTMLISAKLSAEWWAELLSASAYVKNRVPHTAIKGEVPNALYFNKQPSVGHLKRIGSLSFLYDDRRPRNKLQPRSRLGVLVGYAHDTRGYRVWCPDDGKCIRESQSVRFDEKRNGTEALRNAQKTGYQEFRMEEDVQPVSTGGRYNLRPRRKNPHAPRASREEDFFEVRIDETSDFVIESADNRKRQTELQERRKPRHPLSKEVAINQRTAPPPTGDGEDTTAIAAETAKPAPGWQREVAIRQSGKNQGRADIYYRYQGGPRQKTLKEAALHCVRLKLPFDVSTFDFSGKNAVPAIGDPIRGETQSPQVEATAAPEGTSRNGANAKAWDEHRRTSERCEEDEDQEYDDALDRDWLGLNPEALCVEVEVPTTFEEAIHSPQANEWKRAMDEEMSTLHERKVFTKVKKPANKKTIGSRWVYTVKTDANNTSRRYRARLVAQGNTQKKGTDFFETYSPVIAFTLVRVFFILLVVCFGWTSAHLDVKCAYLYGTLTEETYLRPAPGYGDTTQTAWRLHKALYGLHQSGRRWFEELDATFKDLGFRKLLSTNCIYTYKGKAVVLVYVDDLAVFAKDEKTKQEVIALIARRYEVKDLGIMRRFLGVEFERENDRWKIHQESYVDGLAKHFGLENTKNVLVPLDAGVTLRKGPEQETGVVDATSYRSLIGALMFLATRTRPDVLFSVTALSQFNSNPNHDHWRLLRRTLAYAYSTKKIGIMCNVAPGTPALEFYTDSSWASNIEDRKSWSGYVGFLSGTPVTWRVQKQKCVALSTMEAEFVGLSSAVVEVQWLKTICNELSWLPLEPTIVLRCDNEAAIAFAKDNREHMQSKHIDMRYKFVREALQEDVCSLRFVRSKDNIADIFTKPLPRQPFERLRNALVQ